MQPRPIRSSEASSHPTGFRARSVRERQNPRLVSGVAVKSLDAPDAAWTFLDDSRRGAVQFDRVAIGRGVYRPGWRWSQHVKPISGKESQEHIGYVISGRLRVRDAEGDEADVGSGDAFVVGAGHDAWVVGDEPCVALDFIPSSSR
jgi:quercetin dioxygenase-like cupin family protein